MNTVSARWLSVFVVLLAVLNKAPAATLATDGCEFIREKLRILPLSETEVKIPAGTYLCATPVVLNRSHLHLIGEEGVVLKLADKANAPVIVMGAAETPPGPLEDISVSNLQIDGNRDHQSMECWGGPCDSGGKSFVRNNGISVRALKNGRITDVRISRARSGGVVTERGCEGLRIQRLHSSDNFFDGFAGYQTTGTVVSDSVLSHNRAAGISIDIEFNSNTFDNVVIEQNGDVGVFMRNSNHNTFKNVTIHQSGNHGLFLAQVDGPKSCPTDNEFYNLQVTQSSGFGFRLNDSCPGNRLTGTAIFKHNRDGCLSHGGSVGLEIGGTLQCEN